MNLAESQEILAILQQVKTLATIAPSPPNPWIPMWSALGGALVGGILPMFTTLLIAWRNRIRESRAVEGALVAEVSALLSIVEARKYLCVFEKIIAILREQPEGSSYPIGVKVPEHYSRVYQKHVDRLGCLNSNLAAEIISFHQMLDAVVQDVLPGGVLQTEGATLQVYEQTGEILRQAVEAGNRVLHRSRHRAVPAQSFGQFPRSTDYTPGEASQSNIPSGSQPIPE